MFRKHQPGQARQSREAAGLMQAQTVGGAMTREESDAIGKMLNFHVDSVVRKPQ